MQQVTLNVVSVDAAGRHLKAGVHADLRRAHHV